MHFEILVEGQSDVTALSSGILQGILGTYNEPHTWKIHKHQGIGVKNPTPLAPPNIKDRTLLHNLPSKLRAYGNSLSANEVVVVLFDLDNKNPIETLQELNDLLELCTPPPQTIFCFAIEEMEAWFLGDPDAIIKAFPNARVDLLEKYEPDSICGTWELLADIVHPGGAKELLSQGKRSIEILEHKKNWAKKIPPFMNKDVNSSPSFIKFRASLEYFLNRN